MAAARFPPLLVVSLLVSCAFAGYLVIQQQFHPDTKNGSMLAFGWFSPRVEKDLTTDHLVPPTAAESEGASYSRGELDASLSGGLEAAAGAFQGAVPRFHLSQVREARSASSVVITARTAQDQPVEVRLTAAAAGGGGTRVVVLAGDEALARALLEQLRAGP